MNRPQLSALLGMLLCINCIVAAAPRGGPEADTKGRPEFRVTDVSPKGGQLGDRITLRISNLDAWLRSNDTSLPVSEGALTNYVLYLDKIPLPNVSAAGRDGQDGLVFVLSRPGTLTREGEKAREAWAAVLGNPVGFERQMSVSVGYGAQGPLESRARFDFRVIPIDKWFWLCVVALGILLGIFWLLAAFSNLIRESGPEPAGGNPAVFPSNPFKWWAWAKQEHSRAKKPFSLALTQMAFWTVMIFGSYLFVWVITQDRDILPPSALVLLGISTATAFGAVLVDQGKRANAVAQAAVPSAQSQGFLTDILSDGNGISLHRFQIVVWTTVLGIIFVASVYTKLQMPTFSETLLTLLGISGATYVGFKFPEAPKA